VITNCQNNVWWCHISPAPSAIPVPLPGSGILPQILLFPSQRNRCDTQPGVLDNVGIESEGLLAVPMERLQRKKAKRLRGNLREFPQTACCTYTCHSFIHIQPPHSTPVFIQRNLIIKNDAYRRQYFWWRYSKSWTRASITWILQRQNNIMHTHLLALVLKTKQNMILSFDFWCQFGAFCQSLLLSPPINICSHVLGFLYNIMNTMTLFDLSIRINWILLLQRLQHWKQKTALLFI